mmetsp:Transcript_13271/g.55724  ORF Transcript_13271/g.55724 Transcript_13271/m.55724 type:complete len:280 (-) Transcript_13271:1471-2310(-)
MGAGEDKQPPRIVGDGIFGVFWGRLRRDRKPKSGGSRQGRRRRAPRGASRGAPPRAKGAQADVRRGRVASDVRPREGRRGDGGHEPAVRLREHPAAGPRLPRAHHLRPLRRRGGDALRGKRRARRPAFRRARRGFRRSGCAGHRVRRRPGREARAVQQREGRGEGVSRRREADRGRRRGVCAARAGATGERQAKVVEREGTKEQSRVSDDVRHSTIIITFTRRYLPPLVSAGDAYEFPRGLFRVVHDDVSLGDILHGPRALHPARGPARRFFRFSRLRH